MADRVLGGCYPLARELTRGGMAPVWEAEDKVLTRGVAIKVFQPDLAGRRRVWTVRPSHAAAPKRTLPR